MEPRVPAVFAFGKDGEKLDDEFYQSPRLLRHASHYMDIVDRAINLLGPDIELLTDILLELEAQHYAFGVQTSSYPPMGQALLQVLEKFLGEDFTPDFKAAWSETYQALVYDMIRSKKH